MITTGIPPRRRGILRPCGRMKRTRARNSRLARENDKKGRQEPYKAPAAGKKGGMRPAACRSPYAVADQHRRRECDAELGNAGEPYTRTVENVDLGRWEVIEYRVTKWCPRKGMMSTPVPGVMPKQRFGNRVLAMLSFLKMPGVSFPKIVMVFYNVHISKKTIQETVRRVSHALTPQYEAIHGRILEGILSTATKPGGA